MQQFKIQKERYKELIKRTLFIIVPVYFLIIAVVIIMSILKPVEKDADTSTLPFTFVTMILLFAFVIYRLISKQKKLLESYTLIIDKNLIGREMLNTRSITIYFSEISSISKARNGKFIIKGKSNEDIITVPAQIENYDQIESRLKEIKLFDEKSPLTFLQRYPMVISLLVLVLFITFYLSTNNILTLVSGIAMASILLWAFYKIRTNKNISNKAKRNGWLFLLILISVIVTMIMKLTGKA